MVKQWSFQSVSFFQKDSLSLCITSQIQTSWGDSVWPENAKDFSFYFFMRNETKTACQDFDSFRGHLLIAKKTQNKTKQNAYQQDDGTKTVHPLYIWKSLYTGLPQNRFNSCFMPHLQLPLKPPKKTSHTQQHIFNHAETSVDGQPFSGRQGIKIKIKLIKARNEEEYYLNDVG